MTDLMLRTNSTSFYPETQVGSLADLRALINDLQWSGIRPRVHGNGFVQLDLDDQLRVHVWGDHRIPRQKVPTPIHDHAFDFKSHILRGRLINVTYQEAVYPGAIEPMKLPIGRFYEPKPTEPGGEDTTLVNRDPGLYGLFVNDTEIVREGDSYTLAAGVLHESIAPAVCVSVIEKTYPAASAGTERARPRVFVPEGMEPDNRFHRYRAARTDFLWNIVNDALQ